MKADPLRLSLAVAAAAIGILLAAPAFADAARVTSRDGELTYTAGAGERNTLTVTRSEAEVTFVDTTAAMSARGECTQVTPREATCVPGALTVALGDGDDSVSVNRIACECGGAAGADSLLGSALDDRLTGGADDDVLAGGRGDDELRGIEGADALDGGFGPDVINGGSELDTVSYATRGQGVAVSLDGSRNDGNADDGPARDLIAGDVENATGGSGDDVISASAGPNLLVGGAGDDALSAGDGDDDLEGRGGADELMGDDDDDQLDGGDGPDGYSGGAGSDTVSYASRGLGVGVTIGHEANDGNSSDGTGDNVRRDIEKVIGGSGDDGLFGNDSSNDLFGGPGRDHLGGGAGFDSLDGGEENDGLDGGRGGDLLEGGPGEDHLDDGPGPNVGDSLVGGDGVDRMIATGGDDFLSGGPGDDYADGGVGCDSFDGGDDDDVLVSGGVITELEECGNDPWDDPGERFRGGEGDDELFSSGEGSSTLEGGPGTDLLSAGFEDVVDGGPGPELLQTGTVSYAQRTTGVVVTLDGVANDGDESDGPPDARDNVRDTVHGVVTGSGDDTIDRRGVDYIEVDCGAGDDTLISASGDNAEGCEHISS